MNYVYDTLNSADGKNVHNIYYDASYRILQNYLNKLICNNTILSHYPLVSGVIPNFYNQLQAVDRRNIYYKQQYLTYIKRRDIELEGEKQMDKQVFPPYIHYSQHLKEVNEQKTLQDTIVPPSTNSISTKYFIILLFLIALFMIILLCNKYI